MRSTNLDPAKQWTLKEPVSFAGVGLHSGDQVGVCILPAPEGHGLVFSRVDLPGRPRIPALAEYVSNTTLSTTLERGRGSVRTVEHLLGALYGLGITNALMAVDGPEIPALDGSAEPFVRALSQTGRVCQDADRIVISIDDRLEIDSGDRSVIYQPSSEAHVTYVVDYGHKLAGTQCWEGAISPAVVKRDLAPARTFCLLSEAERMRSMGLAKGGTFENAVVVLDDGYSSPLRYSDEFVRHKVLDLLGDLALVGAAWTGQVVAVKAGHPLHVELAGQLRRQALARAKAGTRQRMAAFAS